MITRVWIEKLAENADLLEKQFFEAFSRIQAVDDIRKARTIFLKPNLTYPTYKKGVVTRIEFVKGFIAAFRHMNPNAEIIVGEGEGGYNSFSMDAALKTMGYLDLENMFPRVRVLNLSNLSSRPVAISTPKGPYEISLPEIFFNLIDFSISFPVPKVHCMTKISLSFKNQWGCLPDVMRLKNHHMFDLIISRISETLKFKYAFLDGKYALDVNGPMVGECREFGWFAAANSLGAFDMIIAELMGFDWRDVRHLKAADEYGLMPKRNDIELSGYTESMRCRFVLKRNFWNYAALAAFRSPRLAHLFYFSKYAKFLHDVMYTFRKRPVS